MSVHHVDLYGKSLGYWVNTVLRPALFKLRKHSQWAGGLEGHW